MSKKHKKDMGNYHNLLAETDMCFAAKESFKNIRTGMLYTAKNCKCPIYGITSTANSAGRSLIIANLAVTYAQLGKKVMLIDCDLRTPTQHRIFNVSNRIGLVEVLMSINEGDDGFVTTTDYDGVHLMTSGRIPPNPSELLSSDTMRNLIETLKKEYDCIFLDLPSIAIVTDALVLSDIIDGYIFVVRKNLDEKQSLINAVNKMEQVGAKIIGMILNDVGKVKIHHNKISHGTVSNTGERKSVVTEENSEIYNNNGDYAAYDYV